MRCPLNVFEVHVRALMMGVAEASRSMVLEVKSLTSDLPPHAGPG